MAHPHTALTRSPHAPTSNPYTKGAHKKHDCSDHTALVAHTALFEKKLYSVERVHCFVGWNLANIIIVETDDSSLVVVDTGEDLKQMTDVWDAFQKDTTIDDKVKQYPVAEVILTHHHADHVGGTQFIVDKFPGVRIWGADNLHKEFSQENGLIAPIMTCRAMAQYNNLLYEAFPEEVAGLNSGIGPIITQSTVGYVRPNYTISTETPYEIIEHVFGNTTFQFVYVPSEANSEIGVYLPQRKVLLSAEVIQDHTFPNLYTLRGANFRDPLAWSKAIDSFVTNFSDAQHMVLQHGPPILANEPNKDPADPTVFPVVQVLNNYRDAIQYTRDQTLRWAMKGYAKEEIMHLVNLPKQQADFKPWLQPFYGHIKHSIPAVYTGYIGWFDGDPLALQPIPRSILSARTVEAMGGAEKVLQTANAAYEAGLKLAEVDLEAAKIEWQYAAELATQLIRMRPYLNLTQNPAQQTKAPKIKEKQDKEAKDKAPKDKAAKNKVKSSPAIHLLHADQNEEKDATWWNARQLKAACFRQFASTVICANWYGTYLTAAHELEGDQMLDIMTSKMRFISIVKPGTDVDSAIDQLAIRLQPDDALDHIPVIYLVSQLDTSTVTTSTKAATITTTTVNTSTTTIYKLQIRNSVLVSTVVTAVPYGGVIISGNASAITGLLGGDAPGGFNTVLNSDKVTIKPPGGAGKAEAEKFFAHFEAGRFGKPPNIYVH